MFGVTSIDYDNGKQYKAKISADGQPLYGGKVPDDTQIFLDGIKNPKERKEVEDALLCSPETGEIDTASLEGDEHSTDFDVITVPKNTRLVRYSKQPPEDDKGQYFALEGTEREAISLRNAEQYKYRTVYEVENAFDAEAGLVASAHGEKGGGIQLATRDENVATLTKGDFPSLKLVSIEVQDSEGNWHKVEGEEQESNLSGMENVVSSTMNEVANNDQVESTDESLDEIKGGISKGSTMNEVANNDQVESIDKSLDETKGDISKGSTMNEVANNDQVESTDESLDEIKGSISKGSTMNEVANNDQVKKTDENLDEIKDGLSEGLKTETPTIA